MAPNLRLKGSGTWLSCGNGNERLKTWQRNDALFGAHIRFTARKFRNISARKNAVFIWTWWQLGPGDTVSNLENATETAGQSPSGRYVQGQVAGRRRKGCCGASGRLQRVGPLRMAPWFDRFKRPLQRKESNKKTQQVTKYQSQIVGNLLGLIVSSSPTSVAACPVATGVTETATRPVVVAPPAATRPQDPPLTWTRHPRRK